MKNRIIAMLHRFLMWCAWRGYYWPLYMLAHHPVINDCDDDGNTIMHVAAYRGDLDIYKLVFERGCVQSRNKGTCGFSKGFRFFRYCDGAPTWDEYFKRCESRSAITATVFNCPNPELFKYHMRVEMARNADSDMISSWLALSIRMNTLDFISFVRDEQPELLEARHWILLYIHGDVSLDMIHINTLEEWYEADMWLMKYINTLEEWYGADTRLMTYVHNSRELENMMEIRFNEMMNPFDPVGGPMAHYKAVVRNVTPHLPMDVVTHVILKLL